MPENIPKEKMACMIIKRTTIVSEIEQVSLTQTTKKANWKNLFLQKEIDWQ